MTAQDWINTLNRLVRALCVLLVVALVATCAKAEQLYTVAQCMAEGEIVANAAMGRDYGVPPRDIYDGMVVRANAQGDKVTAWFKADLQRLVWGMYYDYRAASPEQIRRAYMTMCLQNRGLM